MRLRVGRSDLSELVSFAGSFAEGSWMMTTNFAVSGTYNLRFVFQYSWTFIALCIDGRVCSYKLVSLGANLVVILHLEMRLSDDDTTES